MFEHVGHLDVLHLIREHSKPITGAVPTPLATWTRACRGEGGGLGLAPGWHVVVSGSSGQGKSKLMLNMAATAARAGRRVAIISYEMSRHQLLTRFFAIYSGANIRALEPGPEFNQTTMLEAGEVYRETSRASVQIAERPERSIAGFGELMTEAIDLGAQVIVCDYMQKVGVAEFPSIYERTMLVSDMMQKVAFEYQVTTVGLSQFNRQQAFNRKDSPIIEGMMGGGHLEQDADMVALLDSSVYEPLEHGALTKTNIIIGKNRHGPTPKIPVVWDNRTLQIREYDSMQQAQDNIKRRDRL